MDTLTIPVIVGEDRRLVIDLPSSTPTGPADVLIRPRAPGPRESPDQARATARAKLRAAGFLSGERYAPPESIAVSDEDLARLGQLSPGALPSEILIEEDRGPY